MKKGGLIDKLLTFVMWFCFITCVVIFVFLLALPSACFGQEPKPTPIPRIKCYPVELNGKIVDWRCVDVPPECAPKRPGNAK